MTLHITSAFDGGNIIVRDAKDRSNIRLAIRPDNNSDFFSGSNLLNGSSFLKVVDKFVNLEKYTVNCPILFLWV